MNRSDLGHIYRVRLLVEPRWQQVQFALELSFVNNFGSYFGGLSLTSSILTVSVVVAVSGIGNPASTAFITTE